MYMMLTLKFVVLWNLWIATRTNSNAFLDYDLTRFLVRISKPWLKLSIICCYPCSLAVSIQLSSVSGMSSLSSSQVTCSTSKFFSFNHYSKKKIWRAITILFWEILHTLSIKIFVPFFHVFSHTCSCSQCYWNIWLNSCKKCLNVLTKSFSMSTWSWPKHLSDLGKITKFNY